MQKEVRALSELISVAGKNTAVSFSGGKDSLVVLDLAVRAGIKQAVFVDTTIEFEETLRYISIIENFYDIDFTIVRAPIDFFSLVELIGFPSRRFRWCCEVFKFAPLSHYSRQREIEYFVTGLRRDEHFRRQNYQVADSNPLVIAKQFNPIINWTAQDVWNYISKYNLPINPLYKRFKRIGCWCCPFSTDEDWRILQEFYPEKMSQLKKTLLNYSQQLGIQDVHRFVHGFGWTKWASPIERVTGGLFSPCTVEDKNQIDLIFSANNEEQIQRILKILPILADDFFTIGEKLRVTLDKHLTKKLGILVEKAINCIGCGACTSTCEEGALYLRDSSICVDESVCTHCLRCLNTRLLRGACVVRNYSAKRVCLIKR